MLSILKKYQHGIILPLYGIIYLVWFAYVAVTVLYLMWKDRNEFYRLTILLMIGMTLFLLVSTIYPNGHHLRPSVFPRDNIFTDMVAHIYATDSANNILPSIHVFNSMACWFAIRNSRFLKNRRQIQTGAAALTVSIVLSTVFIKQHSVVDLICGLILSALLYPIFYCPESPVFYRNLRKHI